MTTTHAKTGGNKGQGSKWCDPNRRWAIYMRDNWTCVYCERDDWVTGGGYPLTLDHVVPRAKPWSGSNDSNNVVVSCRPCNAAKGNKSLDEFAPTRAPEIRKRLRVKIDTRAAREHMKADEAFVTRVRNTSNPAHSAYKGAS